MPDLGPYAFAITGAYASSLLLLAILIAMTYRSSQKTKRLLDALEPRDEK